MPTISVLMTIVVQLLQNPVFVKWSHQFPPALKCFKTNLQLDAPLQQIMSMMHSGGDKNTSAMTSQLRGVLLQCVRKMNMEICQQNSTVISVSGGEVGNLVAEDGASAGSGREGETRINTKSGCSLSGEHSNMKAIVDLIQAVFSF